MVNKNKSTIVFRVPKEIKESLEYYCEQFEKKNNLDVSLSNYLNKIILDHLNQEAEKN